MNTTKKRNTFTAEYKQKLLDDYTKSQLNVRNFIALKGVGESTFTRWLRESKAIARHNINNLPETSNSSSLFFELTPSTEHTPYTNDFTQKSLLTNNQVNCIISMPNGITIKVDALVVDQLAHVIKGLLL